MLACVTLLRHDRPTVRTKALTAITACAEIDEDSARLSVLVDKLLDLCNLGTWTGDKLSEAIDALVHLGSRPAARVLVKDLSLTGRLISIARFRQVLFAPVMLQWTKSGSREVVVEIEESHREGRLLSPNLLQSMLSHVAEEARRDLQATAGSITARVS